jgi:hypothetical protein
MDTHGITMATYDPRMGSIFQQQQEFREGTTFGLVQYVGVFRDIILLDYG